MKTPDNYFFYDKKKLEELIRKECEDFKSEKVEIAVNSITEIFSFVFREKERKFKLTILNTKFLANKNKSHDKI